MSIPTRTVKLKELADFVGAKIKGDAETTISGIATLEKAQDNNLSFFSNRKYFKYLSTTQASAVILNEDDVEHCATNAIIVDDPYLAYAKIATHLTVSPNKQSKIHSTAVIADEVTLGENVNIHAHVVISRGAIIDDNVTIESGCVIGSEVKIGKNSILYPNVSIYKGVTLGHDVIVHAGVVIGSDGFGIANEQGQWIKVPQLGSVEIGHHVEIGANTTIDRGAIESTIIEDGVKLDNQIQIAHNVHIGRNTAIAGCVGIAGSTTIGEACAIGGGAGILGHLTIADHVHITATSLVTKSIKKSGVYSSGMPLQDNALWHKNFARLKQLDSMARRLSQLEKKAST